MSSAVGLHEVVGGRAAEGARVTRLSRVALPSVCRVEHQSAAVTNKVGADDITGERPQSAGGHPILAVYTAHNWVDD